MHRSSEGGSSENATARSRGSDAASDVQSRGGEAASLSADMTGASFGASLGESVSLDEEAQVTQKNVNFVPSASRSGEEISFVFCFMGFLFLVFFFFLLFLFGLDSLLSLSAFPQ